jgi:hypothetical protein
MFGEIAAIVTVGGGVNLIHGIVTSIPVAGHVGSIVRGGKGTIARKIGVSKSAVSAKSAEARKVVKTAKSNFSANHGPEGHFNSYVPFTDENMLSVRAEAVKTDIYNIPRRVNEIVLVGNHLGWGKTIHWVTGFPMPGSESLLHH